MMIVSDSFMSGETKEVSLSVSFYKVMSAFAVNKYDSHVDLCSTKSIQTIETQIVTHRNK